VRALILDCDGVLAETERDVHLPAFNQAFRELGVPVHWSDEEYGAKLRVSGGKERMATALGPELVMTLGGPIGENGLEDLLRRLHARKTAITAEILASRPLPARPGVRRLITAAHQAGWKLAVASTSAEATVRLVVRGALGAPLAETLVILAGDVVSSKKPDPEIYELAIATLGTSRNDAIAIEDSRNGLLAANAAGLACVITESHYTRGEDFTEAALVMTSLGDPETPMTILANRSKATPAGHLTLADFGTILDSARSPHLR
jgi:HAD superfamily hydrolase (TIGR01509 family)